MRGRIVTVWAILLIVLSIMPVYADKRVALVVGNDRYTNLSADEQLRKAVNDARAVGDVLIRLGFEVIRGENLGREGLVDKLDQLSRRLMAGDTAFFYFSGHGVGLGGGNYILPSDVPNVEAGQETRLARAALGESDIVSDLLARGVRVAVVVLDACRSNPFKRSGRRAIGAEQGLSERGIRQVDSVTGPFTIYSAGFGQAALDRLSDDDPNPNSVFTRVLLPALVKPGLDLAALAVDVREEVARLARTVGHDQRPAYYDETIGGRVYLAATTPAAASENAAGQIQDDRAERAWSEIKNTTSKEVLAEFIGRFGDSFYASIARDRLARLQPTTVIPAPPEPHAPEPARQGSQPSWCREQTSYNAAEQEVCRDPPLWPLEAELNRAYDAAKQKSDVTALRTSETEWKRMRDACGSNQTCLKNAYQSRIAELELPRPSPESGSYRQPPWCREQSSYNAAEQEICGSPPFWALDAELNRVYVAARQKTGVKALAASEMRWKKARDACGSNQACLKDAYQKRIQVLRQL